MLAASDFNRSLSQIFSNSVFRQIAQSGTNPYIFSKLKKYDDLLSVEPGMKIKNILENAYSYLAKNYRNEYLYKNLIINKILLGRHNLRTATMLNEFKIGSSIADIVILNGTSTVYEIKTELDTADKLQKQIEDYRKVFAKIYLVTHHTLSTKYLTLLMNNNNVGLLSLSGRFNLTTIREAEEDYSAISNEAIMRSLRKNEYSKIVSNLSGTLPNVSNIYFFAECLKIAQKSEPKELHALMLQQLRSRTLINPAYLESGDIPKELKHICLCIDPNKREYDNLFQFLNLNL